jgi:hypothetical protein
MAAEFRPPTGHVFRVERSRGPCWYAKYRLPDGRQVQKKLGPAWTERGRPPAGYYTKRLAEDWLREVLAQARRGTLPGMVRTGATFADAAAEYLRYIEHDRGRKPSTVRGELRDRRVRHHGGKSSLPPSSNHAAGHHCVDHFAAKGQAVSASRREDLNAYEGTDDAEIASGEIGRDGPVHEVVGN